LEIRKIIISHLFILLLISCSTKQLITTNLNVINKKLSQEQLKSWQHKDLISDSIPGISLDKAYQELIKNKKGKDIIVAVIDMQLDINHEELNQSIWKNKKEIPNNNIDDDNNGYIDDIHGWNFLGNSKGESVYESNFEYVRIVRNYNSFIKTNNNKIILEDNNKYIIYKKADSILQVNLKEYKNEVAYYKKYKIRFNNWKLELKKYFPNEKYTIKKLKSIKTNNNKTQDAINKITHSLKYDLMDRWIDKTIKNNQRYLDFYLNINYNDRELIGDDENNIEDTNYGFHNVGINQNLKTYHATYVTGLLSANRNNKIGINGISNNIKIMPIVVASNGDENDKDIALAIRYAVNNGAKIINMSFGKAFSTNKVWVTEALKHAEKHNVLCVHSAGNEFQNIDIVNDYPNDIDGNNKEILNNFIVVGASTRHVNNKLVSDFSNYGRNNVDIFAPGETIYTTKINNTYKFKSGTSMATPLVSGIAALIWLQYPKLKAHEVKEIILESGVSYDIDVELPSYDEEKKLVPFKSLSKSGKIVNAYNALLLAKHYKKWKKGKWKIKK